MQSGELIVVSKNSLSIFLNGHPSEVHAKFKHDIVPAPCDHGSPDFLEYEVVSDDASPSGVSLLIRWNVSGAREIVWHACY